MKLVEIEKPCVCGHLKWQHWFVFPDVSYCIMCGVSRCGRWRVKGEAEKE